MSMSRRSLIPDLRFDHDCAAVSDYFFEARRLIDGIDNVLTMDHIEQWQKHSGIVLLRWEREAVFAMDRAYRQGYRSAVEFHHKRKQKPKKNQGM